MKTKRILIFGAALMALALPVSAKQDPAPANPKAAAKPGKVQIAILLDTSGSMEGLITQAKSQLWKVVNTFTSASKDGAVPFVEVALYEYGNSGLHVGNNYIRQIEPFSRDLDEISRELFSLSTNGGEEYCGAVIQRALSDLSWDAAKDTYKVIFIAGNEPFTQGGVDPRQACKDAMAKGVVVNSIHCGSREEGMRGSWHDGPALAGGKYLVIDQDKAVAYIPAPQDKEIADLGTELNKTYIGYGDVREEAVKKQVEADNFAGSIPSAPAAPAERAITKASGNYNNSAWDLVDGVREKKVKLEEVPADQLPENMRGMKPEERTAYVEEAARKRSDIQKRINTLAGEREAFLEKEQKNQAAAAGEKTLDEVIADTTREQAGRLGYVFGK